MTTAVPERAVRPTAREKRAHRRDPVQIYEDKKQELEEVKGAYRAAQDEAQRLADAGEDNAAEVEKRDTLIKRWRRLQGELLGHKNRADRKAVDQHEKRSAKNRARYAGIDVETDTRTAGGARDREVIDNRRFDKDAKPFTRKQPPSRMFDRSSDCTRLRELAIDAFDAVYHEAGREQGVKSPSIEIKVDVSHGTGRAPKGAYASRKLSSIRTAIGDVNLKILVERIINDKPIPRIAEEMGQPRRMAGSAFALSLDIIGPILGVQTVEAA